MKSSIAVFLLRVRLRAAANLNHKQLTKTLRRTTLRNRNITHTTIPQTLPTAATKSEHQRQLPRTGRTATPNRNPKPNIATTQQQRTAQHKRFA